MKPLNVLSLFSGIEGIGRAMDLVNQIYGREIFRLVCCCEIDPYAVSVLKKRYPGVPIHGDIRTLSKTVLHDQYGISRIDMVTGGFPCQPFSLAGERAGEDDDRYLWPEMFRIVGEFRPRWVLGENVAGLLSIADLSGRKGGTFGAILHDLAALGNRVGWACYGAGDIGAPHQRDRVFILANASGFGK